MAEQHSKNYSEEDTRGEEDRSNIYIYKDSIMKANKYSLKRGRGGLRKYNR
jgi:hypothetical protein